MTRTSRTLLLIAATALVPATVSAQQQRQRGGPGGFDGFGRVALLGQESVQKELKVTDEQKQKISQLAESRRDGNRPDGQNASREERRRRFAERAEADNKAIGEILDSTQQARLEQISLQLRGAMAFADPKVAEQLNLTDDQKNKIRQIGEESREQMRSLFEGGDRANAREKITEIRDSAKEKAVGALSDEQKSKWTEMIGAPFAGELRRPERQQRRQRTTFAPATPPAVLLTAAKDSDDKEKAKEGEDGKKKSSRSDARRDEPRRRPGREADRERSRGADAVARDQGPSDPRRRHTEGKRDSDPKSSDGKSAHRHHHYRHHYARGPRPGDWSSRRGPHHPGFAHHRHVHGFSHGWHGSWRHRDSFPWRHPGLMGIGGHGRYSHFGHPRFHAGSPWGGPYAWRGMPGHGPSNRLRGGERPTPPANVEMEKLRQQVRISSAKIAELEKRLEILTKAVEASR